MAGRDDEVFRALASPHRRRLLDLLRTRARTTGDLAERMKGLSRFAVMQHLGVLEEAGLVVVRRDGRQRFNHLNAVPLRRVYERWVGRFADRAAEEALALGRYLEEGTMTDRTTRAVRIENEIAFRAPRERVFRALTVEQDKWYPYNYGGERLKAIRFEERLGGLCYEDWGDGAGIVYGVVTFWDPPRAVQMRGHLQGGVSLEHTWKIEVTDEGCVLTQSLVAFGELSDDEVAGIRTHGDLTKVADRFKAYVEDGAAVGA